MTHRVGNDIRKIIKLQAEKGRVTIVDVLHDDWCAHFTGDLCDCDPEIMATPLARDDEHGHG